MSSVPTSEGDGNDASPNVTQELQETQDTQESQRTSGKYKEPHRVRGVEEKLTPQQIRERTFHTELSAGIPSSLPFDSFVALAITECGAAKREGRFPGWQSSLFYFMRLLKVHPSMEKIEPAKALKKVESTLVIWQHLIPPHLHGDGWRHWFSVGHDDAVAEFYDAWDKIRYLPGFSPLDNAIELARRKPLTTHDENRKARPPQYQLFISIAGWLQIGMGNKNILLPVHDLAARMGVEPMTITRYRKWAKEDGFLFEKKAHKFRSKGEGGRATEFRFDVSRWPILKSRASAETLDHGV